MHKGQKLCIQVGRCRWKPVAGGCLSTAGQPRHWRSRTELELLNLSSQRLRLSVAGVLAALGNAGELSTATVSVLHYSDLTWPVPSPRIHNSLDCKVSQAANHKHQDSLAVPLRR